MKYVLLLVSICAICYEASGDAIVKVFESGQEISLDNIEVIVGSELEFVVSVDANDYWSGGLFLSNEYRNLGSFTGRDTDPNTRDCENSHLMAAGELAEATPWEDSYLEGFDLYGSLTGTSKGDWFILDYHPQKVGNCNIDFYDYGLSWNDPNFQITIKQILPGDCTGDSVVDMNDFAVLASYWNVTDCNDPNGCGRADFDLDEQVDLYDMILMAHYWLTGASYEPNIVSDPNTLSDPNAPVDPNASVDPNYIYPEDPNVVYSIVDANGLSEITIDVNDTVTLYINKTSSDPNLYNVRILSVEAFSNDPNLGYIDNTPYDTNNPPGTGTARILFEPRWSSFDDWGPGIEDPNGIYFLAVNPDSIADGDMVSFEYTATQEGDAVLEIYTESDPYPKLESIIIHQVDPNSP